MADFFFAFSFVSSNTSRAVKDGVEDGSLPPNSFGKAKKGISCNSLIKIDLT